MLDPIFLEDQQTVILQINNSTDPPKEHWIVLILDNKVDCLCIEGPIHQNGQDCVIIISMSKDYFIQEIVLRRKPHLFWRYLTLLR